MQRKNTPESVGKVAIVGRPNVGKSALFNRLAGRNIAIVHDQPGITRDRLAAPCMRGPRPFTVWDTGGIGGAGEVELRTQVRGAADAAMRESDVILFVVDAQDGLTPIDQELARILRKSKTPVVLVINKIDHPKHEDLESDFARLGFASSVPISAAHGRGISGLLETIDSLLPASDAAIDQPSTSSHPLALAIVGRPNAGKSSLINSILRDARTIVSELPGTTRDAVDILYERDGEQFLLIDTAGIRARSKHSSSVEVFSVMRAERTIRRADLCVLVIDLTSGVTGQDKKIAGLIQKAEKPCLVVLEQMGSGETEARRESRDGANRFRDAGASFLSRLRACLDRLGADGRERRAAFPLDRGCPAGCARAPGDGRAESFVARRLRGKSAADNRNAPPEIILCRASERRRRADARSVEIHPVRQSAKAAQRNLRALSRRAHSRGGILSRLARALELSRAGEKM